MRIELLRFTVVPTGDDGDFGLASLLDLLLLFWNKVVGIFSVVHKFSRSGTPAAVDAPKETLKELRKFGSAACAEKSSSSVWTGSNPALWKRCWNAVSFPTWQKFAPPAVTPA